MSINTGGSTPLRPTPPPAIDESLRDEASRRITPILQRANEKGMGTVMYLAAMELQKAYPGLKPHELEALLLQSIKPGKTS